MNPIVNIFITVRLKSTRLPEKALKILQDQTIIEHIIDRTKLIKTPHQVVLCTSSNPQDAPLIEIAKKKGIAYFAGSENNIVKRFLDAAGLFSPQVIVRITGDNCLFSPEIIDLLIQQHIQHQNDYTSAKDIPGGSKGDVFSYQSLKKLDELIQDENASEYLSWLLAEESYFKVEWIEVPTQYKRPQYRLHCDTPSDYLFLQHVYQDLYKKQQPISFDALIQYLDQNPAVASLNQNIKQISRTDIEHSINLSLGPTKNA